MPGTVPRQIKDEISGKVCLITGASRALGSEIARCMAHCGAHVAVNYDRSPHAARTLCDELTALGVKAVPVQADVSQPEQVTRLLTETREQLGPIDILVNNVGPYVDTPFLDLSLADFRILEGNIRTTFTVSQAIGRYMKEQRRGHIVNIAATDIFHRSNSIYGLAKAASFI